METKKVAGYYQVSPKENSYFALRVVFSLLIYGGLGYSFYNASKTGLPFTWMPFALILLYVAIFYFFFNGLFVGMIKTNSVKLNDKQLPEVYAIVKNLSRSLNLTNVPNTYLLQSGGTLNAFAKKFMGSNYVVIYSDLLEAFYEGNIDAVEFVVAHELGHIKRTHFLKSLLIFPSAIVPFLGPAYNRACELTCDNIGKFFNPKGAVDGLLILAGGKRIAREINLQAYIEQQYTDTGFWRWLAEKSMMNHPPLYKRLANVYDHTISRTSPSAPKQKVNEQVPETPQTSEPEKPTAPVSSESDYRRYMPS